MTTWSRSKAIAGIAIGAAVVYFTIVVFVLPDTYASILSPPKPKPVITDVSLSTRTIKLGESFTLHVNSTNQGDLADRQIVSIGFPNATKIIGEDATKKAPNTITIKVLESTFKHSPSFIYVGQKISSGYTEARQTIVAQYPAIEVFSSPWQKGESFSISLSVKPEHEGKFIIFVKAVGLPYNGDQAHWPASNGILDQQDEYVNAYSVVVTSA